jgi:hypothetical protein
VAAAGVAVEDDQDLARPALGPDDVRQHRGELGGARLATADTGAALASAQRAAASA